MQRAGLAVARPKRDQANPRKSRGKVLPSSVHMSRRQLSLNCRLGSADRCGEQQSPFGPNPGTSMLSQLLNFGCNSDLDYFIEGTMLPLSFNKRRAISRNSAPIHGGFLAPTPQGEAMIERMHETRRMFTPLRCRWCGMIRTGYLWGPDRRLLNVVEYSEGICPECRANCLVEGLGKQKPFGRWLPGF